MTTEFFSELDPRPRVVAEIGCYQGHTSRAFVQNMPADGELHLYDFLDTATAAKNLLLEEGWTNVVVHGNSSKVLDSYNWSLMKVLAANSVPIYDYVMIDGAHTWHHDALSFFLVDRLLKPGGHLDFDDYLWTFSHSPSLNPTAFPKTNEWYTEEQIRTPQVKLIVDLLVRQDSRYTEVVKDRIFRKR